MSATATVEACRGNQIFPVTDLASFPINVFDRPTEQIMPPMNALYCMSARASIGVEKRDGRGLRSLSRCPHKERIVGESM